MSEKENYLPSNSFEVQTELSDLESAFTDPFVERVLEMGRTYNKIFADTDPSNEEVSSIIAELDDEWGSIIKSNMRYTGNVDVSLLDGTRELKNVFFDGTEVVTDGFTVDRVKQYVDGEEINTRYEVKHLLLVPVTTVYGDDAEVEGVQYAAAKGDITNSHLELESASPEHARAWLTLACPELIDELDELVFNSEGGDDEAILSLATIDLNRFTQLEDKFLRHCVEIYLTSIIEIDITAPYSASLFGRMYKTDEEQNSYLVDADRVLVYISHFNIVPYKDIEGGDSQKWMLTVPLGIVSEAVSPHFDTYVAPISTITQLQSIRRNYYAENS